MALAPLEEFRARCSECVALCCVALPFARSADFPFTKAGGEPCRNLLADHRCSVHTSLRERGFRGCTVFDCVGAGPLASSLEGVTEPERWRAFESLRPLQEMRWYLTDALDRDAARGLHARVRAELVVVEGLAASGRALVGLDVGAVRGRVGALLGEVSEVVRSRVPGRRDLRNADLIGKAFRGASLRGASLRGAYLIGADLRDADLVTADLLGADLRDADLRGADLTDALFLTQAQVNAARGSSSTRLPARVLRPSHWP